MGPKEIINRFLKSDFMKYQKFPLIIGALTGVFIIEFINTLWLNIHAVLYLDSSGILTSFILFLLKIMLPFILFIWSTAFDFYNYWTRKIAYIYFIFIHCLAQTWGQLLRIIIPLTVPLVLKIPISTEVTKPMVVNLARGIVFLLSIIPIISAGIFLRNIIEEPYNKSHILKLKVMKLFDLRKNRKFLYDFKVISDISTGKLYTVKEKDRTLHSFADGTTGTAKTSSVLSVAICNDLNQKVYNENYQRKMCYHYLKTGEFKAIRPFTDATFSINYIQPDKESGFASGSSPEKAYDFLKYVSQTIGITCFAPNAAFADEIYDMATSRGFPVNRVDPILTADSQQKPGFIGFNPLYTSPLLSGIARDVDITNKATIFADILQCLYEASGSGDAYFISLNNSVTIAICKLLMLTHEKVHGRQPNPSDVQLCINDFSLCEPYLRVLTQLYGKNGEPMDEIQQDDMDDRVRYDVHSSPKNVNCGLWQDIYTLIKDDLLGPNKDNMFDRSNGLRLQVNNFLNHPLIRRVLCAEKTIDLDQALSNGEITIVNYSLELGDSVSTAFGLFYLLSFSKAVLRRPGTENTRTLHMIYIDEFSCLLHRSLEVFFTLFRQYKVGNMVAFQTLDQLDKNETTKYLKGVLLGNCAHQIIFGRVSPTEMKIYETMGGKVMKPIEQSSVTETSITSENPSYSYSVRNTEQLGNLIEGHEIRNRDFQEVTFYTVNDNSPVPPFVGKVHFLSSKKRKGKPIKNHNWEPFFKNLSDGQGASFENTMTNMDKLHTNVTINHTQRNPNRFLFTASGLQTCGDPNRTSQGTSESLPVFYRVRHEKERPEDLEQKSQPPSNNKSEET